jgi:anti-sigma regulatory factor (Ser/Thr protein kinase)
VRKVGGDDRLPSDRAQTRHVGPAVNLAAARADDAAPAEQLVRLDRPALEPLLLLGSPAYRERERSVVVQTQFNNSLVLSASLTGTPRVGVPSSSTTLLWLEELGATGGEVFDVSLAATKAFGNAVEHPHEPTARLIEIDGITSDHTVSITIHDFGSWRDERQREEGGYGFPLMRKLMDTVDVDTGAAGTSITLRRRLGSLAN